MNASDPFVDWLDLLSARILAAEPGLTENDCQGLLWGRAGSARFPNATLEQAIDRMTVNNGYQPWWTRVVWRFIRDETPNSLLLVLVRRLVQYDPMLAAPILRQVWPVLDEDQRNTIKSYLRQFDIPRLRTEFSADD